MKRKNKQRKRLTIEDRMVIQACIHQGMNITEIASRLEVNKSTISREINKYSYIKEGKDLSCSRMKAGGTCNKCNAVAYCKKRKKYYDFALAEEKVIDCIFRQHMTLQEAEKEFGVTRERIRQVQIKALRKIKRYRYYFEVSEYANKKELAKQNYQKYLEQNKKEWKYEEAKEFVKNYESEHKQEIAMKTQIGIEDLDLSIRSYNCLGRAGIRYLSELLSKSVEDLIKIRNIGRKSLKEIIDKLKEKGYHLKEFER